MNSVLIYPFGKESEYWIKFTNLLDNLQPVCLVALQGWDDRKVFIDNDKESIPFSFEFEKSIVKYNPEFIFFADFRFPLDFEIYYLPYIKMAIRYNKKILFGENLKYMLRKKYPTILRYEYTEESFMNTKMEIPNSLMQINTPVIFISSMFGGLGKFEIQLKLRKAFLERNVNLMQIDTKEESQYYGFYPMPEFMKNHENSEKDKILLFNRYLKKLEEVKKPDIILIGIPGELYAPSEKYIANLGITAYEIFLSVMPDILLVLLPYAEYREEDYESIRKSIIQKYGVNPDYLIPTNLRLQLDETETYQKERYLTIVEPDNEEDADLYESNYIEKITDDILKKLTINGQIKSI